jgi:hypothetical protein
MKEHLEKHAQNINEVTIPKGGRVIVVGDTHGQLLDLLTILDLGGRIIFLYFSTKYHLNTLFSFI